MKTYEKSHKLDNVCHDIRGPIMEEANRMIRGGEDVLRLDIGNPACFGFHAPEAIVARMAESLPRPTATPTPTVSWPTAPRRASPAWTSTTSTRGNGVSELVTVAMQGLLDDGDGILVPSPDYPLWTATVTLAGGRAVHYVCDEASDW